MREPQLTHVHERHLEERSDYRRISHMSRRITERKVRLDGTHVEFDCEPLLIEPGRRAIVRYEIDRDRAIPGTDLVVPAGAVTIAHYWMDRPYNVYHWLAGGRTLAYYCNVAEPLEVTDDLVSYLDLVVDVLVRPTGPSQVLDEDELPADLDPRFRQLLARALEQLADPGPISREIERESRRYL